MIVKENIVPDKALHSTVRRQKNAKSNNPQRIPKR